MPRCMTSQVTSSRPRPGSGRPRPARAVSTPHASRITSTSSAPWPAYRSHPPPPCLPSAFLLSTAVAAADERWRFLATSGQLRPAPQWPLDVFFSKDFVQYLPAPTPVRRLPAPGKRLALLPCKESKTHPTPKYHDHDV